jgi:hypothetical protein
MSVVSPGFESAPNGLPVRHVPMYISMAAVPHSLDR